MTFCIIITTILAIVGLWLYINNPWLADFPEQLQRRRTMRRRFGVLLIATAIVAGVWCLCCRVATPSRVEKRGNLPGGSCGECGIYQTRSKQLRPYAESEYGLLSQHVQACKSCSDECTSYLARNPQNESVKRGCITATEAAIKSRREFDRLTDRLRGKKTAVDVHLFKTGPQDPFLNARLFPPVPKDGL